MFTAVSPPQKEHFYTISLPSCTTHKCRLIKTEKGKPELLCEKCETTSYNSCNNFSNNPQS